MVISLLILELVVVLIGAELLVRRLPKSIREAVTANARRLDGSRSTHREIAERRSIRRMRQQLVLVIVLLLVPTNFAGYLFHTHVVPLPLGLEAFSVWEASPDEWKKTLQAEGVSARFSRWKTRPGSGVSSVEHAEAARQTLWKVWPAVAIIGVSWFAICFSVLQTAYMSALQELKRGVDYRSQQYMYRDVSRFSEL